MTPVPRHGYRIGVPRPGAGASCSTPMRASTAAATWATAGLCSTVPVQSHGEAQSLELTLPPLSALFLRPDA